MHFIEYLPFLWKTAQTFVRIVLLKCVIELSLK